MKDAKILYFIPDYNRFGGGSRSHAKRGNKIVCNHIILPHPQNRLISFILFVRLSLKSELQPFQGRSHICCFIPNFI